MLHRFAQYSIHSAQLGLHVVSRIPKHAFGTWGTTRERHSLSYIRLLSAAALDLPCCSPTYTATSHP